MAEKKIIEFLKPVKVDYTSKRDLAGFLCCPPIKMGRGCYGDCYDCYTMHKKWYDNIKE